MGRLKEAKVVFSIVAIKRVVKGSCEHGLNGLLFLNL